MAPWSLKWTLQWILLMAQLLSHWCLHIPDRKPQQLHMLISDRMPFNACRHIPLHSAWGQHDCCYIACLRVQGRNGAVCVIALAERGALFDPGPCMYMEKLAVGPAVDPKSVSLNKSIAENLAVVAKALKKPIG